MFDDLKIRNKLVLLVVGPLVIVLILATLGARDRQQTADEGRQVERLVAVSQSNAQLVEALQQEAIFSTAHVASDRERWADEVEASRAATDAEVGETLEQMSAVASSASPGFRATSAVASDAVGKLEYIRRAVDQGYTWPQVAQTYGTLQYSFLEVNNSVGDAVGDQRVAAELRTVAALGAYKGAQATRGSLLLGGLESGGTLADEPHGLLTGATEESELSLIHI